VGQCVRGTIAELARGPAPWTPAEEHSPSDSLVFVALTLQDVSDERDPNAPKRLYRGQVERALAHLREKPSQMRVDPGEQDRLEQHE
jgi:hypothetical protein